MWALALEWVSGERVGLLLAIILSPSRQLPACACACSPCPSPPVPTCAACSLASSLTKNFTLWMKAEKLESLAQGGGSCSKLEPSHHMCLGGMAPYVINWRLFMWHYSPEFWQVINVEYLHRGGALLRMGGAWVKHCDWLPLIAFYEAKRKFCFIFRPHPWLPKMGFCLAKKHLVKNQKRQKIQGMEVRLTSLPGLHKVANGHLGSADERKNYRARNGDLRTIWNTPVLNRFFRSDTALACLAS